MDQGVVVGDDAGNGELKGFLTFDLSGIPAGATLVAATLNLGSFQKEGTPLEDLGALTAYLVNYGDLDGSDWDLQASSTPARYERLSAVSQDQDVLPSVKLAFHNGWDYQLRLEFAHPASNDGQEDSFEFNTGGGGVRLVVTYTGG